MHVMQRVVRCMIMHYLLMLTLRSDLLIHP
jgi:hypothetical protein